MTQINHALRQRILDAVGEDRLTAQQIAARVERESAATIHSSLRAMFASRQLKRTKGAPDKPPLWWAA
jgi:hypothetical protein